MDESVLNVLEKSRSRIKQRWESLLRSQPVASPLASPDTLIFLMDDTLTQLCAAGRKRSLKSWRKHQPALLAPLRNLCTCGINPLLSYHSTGLLALEAIARPVLGKAFEEVALYYHSIAEQDIEALCGLCCHKNENHYAQPQIAREAARQAPRLGR